MKKMLFDLKQEKVTIVPLPDGMWDVTVLDNEEVVTDESLGMYGGMEPGMEARLDESHAEPREMYQYDGNIFRTVYEPDEDEILSDMGKWLDYSTEGEPTAEQVRHDNELIDQLTMELVEGGIL